MYRLLASLALLCAVPVLTHAESWARKPFFAKSILLGAHRGGAIQWPENTIYGFQQAVTTFPGVLLETDVHLTSDGAVVLLHDEKVDRTTNGTGEVTGMTLDQVKALDAGHKFTRDNGATFPHRGEGLTIPTLKETLDALPDSLFLVELKGDPPLADAAIAVIREAKAEGRILFASKSPATMDRARQLAPELAYCYDMKNGMSMFMALRSPAWANYAPQADVLSINEKMFEQYKLTADEIRKMQAKGIRFQVHTINDPERMKHFVEQGVDSILTDNLAALAQVIADAKTATK